MDTPDPINEPEVANIKRRRTELKKLIDVAEKATVARSVKEMEDECAKYKTEYKSASTRYMELMDDGAAPGEIESVQTQRFMGLM
jgi:hypothetical protein